MEAKCLSEKASWRSILRTNKSGTILLGKETMEARGKSTETLNAANYQHKLLFPRYINHKGGLENYGPDVQ